VKVEKGQFTAQREKGRLKKFREVNTATDGLGREVLRKARSWEKRGDWGKTKA